MYKQTHELPAKNKMVCPKCKSTMFRVNYGKVTCIDCGWSTKGSASNKYGAIKTVANDGVKRDSKYEASIADELLLRKQTGDILDYDSQFKVEMWICNEQGERKIKVTHKVDFRAHLKDGSFELQEAKGVETMDYRWRRRLLEELWLPQHPDHTYLVLKQRK